MGDFEAGALAFVESPLKYHPDVIEVLTLPRDPGRGPCMAGSLTGAVSSQRVTEELEGTLSAVGYRAESALAKACLTARLTGRAETKVGTSDPAPACGSGVAQRIKGTPGITG